MFYAVHHKSDLGCYGAVASVSCFRQTEKEIGGFVGYVWLGAFGPPFYFLEKIFFWNLCRGSWGFCADGGVIYYI